MTPPPSKTPSSAPPAAKLDDAYIRKTLRSIKDAQSKQSRIEAERTGASKMTSRLLAVFGSMITAGAIGCFVWVWDAQQTSADQGAAIHRVERMQTVHSDLVGHPDLAATQHATERRIDGIEAAQKAIGERLDRSERDQLTRHRELLEELRHLRAASRQPRTWGGR